MYIKPNMTSGTLHIVATPIGNLADMTDRAKTTLHEVDLILCEDTRHTRKLMQAYSIDTPLMSYHQHSGEKKYDDIKKLLDEGKDLALVTDAGTPGISDPGNQLIAFLADNSEHTVISAVPGASAVVAALSISGFPTDKFIFMGFPPHKKKRNQFFEEIAASKHTVAFYESPYRITKALDALADVLDPNKKIVVCRELTKKFESIYRGTIEEIIAMQIPEKGEFVVVVQGA